MQTIRKVQMSALAFLTILLAACGSKTTKTETTSERQTMQVDDLLAHAETLVGDTVTIEGICTHLCKHGGRKMFLMGSDDTQTLRAEAAALGAFDKQSIGHVVTLTGIVREDRIDEAYLSRWESQIAAQVPEMHGDKGEAGCDTEKKARQETANTPQGRIDDFRAKIAERQTAEGKDYLSFYHVDALSYQIAE